jgi:hypothetical protein
VAYERVKPTYSPRAAFAFVPDVRTDRYDHQRRSFPTTFEQPDPLSDVLHRYYATTTPTPWCRILLGKLKVSQLVKKFPAFYGTRRFITAITTATTYPYPKPDQYIPRPAKNSFRSVVILRIHPRLGLQNDLFPSLPKPCLQLCPLLILPHYPPIFFLI